MNIIFSSNIVCYEHQLFAQYLGLVHNDDFLHFEVCTQST